MNDTAIISAVAVFLVFLGFSLWLSLSARVISTEEVLVRAGITVAVLLAILGAGAGHHHRNAH